jgi:flagellar biosynthesis protein FliR
LFILISQSCGFNNPFGLDLFGNINSPLSILLQNIFNTVIFFDINFFYFYKLFFISYIQYPIGTNELFFSDTFFLKLISFFNSLALNFSFSYIVIIIIINLNLAILTRLINRMPIYYILSPIGIIVIFINLYCFCFDQLYYLQKFLLNYFEKL